MYVAFYHGEHCCLLIVEEAENERMHLMTALQLKQPSYMFRMGVVGTQGMFTMGILGTYGIFRLCVMGTQGMFRTSVGIMGDSVPFSGEFVFR